MGCGFVSHSTFVEVVCVVFFLIYLLSMLHYKIVILHAGIHLCFFSVIGDAVTVQSVNSLYSYYYYKDCYVL